VGTVTYFRKQTKNLVDTKTFVPGDSKLARDFGYAEYVNTPYADAWGFETLLTRERGAWVTGEISYTYMVAEGTSGSAEDGFYIAQYGLPPAVRVFPLSWDQRHTLKGTVSVRLSWRMTATFAGEWHSGRPYTNYPTSTGYEEVDGGAFVQNNARMPAAATVDLKLLQEFSPDWWPGARLALLLDVRNLFNVRNVLWVDSNGRVGGELDDPAARSAGRRTWLGLEAGF
jgi:outer membrane receptor for ferrienterochelin and colicin